MPHGVAQRPRIAKQRLGPLDEVGIGHPSPDLDRGHRVLREADEAAELLPAQAGVFA
ncbi:hypothetical protein SCOCK_340057 [Actinacidiphila cocklensis]|uniref:Uncharacterized protein n=1 Tax=Actinacidiphila cocklensis TaxID=887465 RepID=A0A9W4GTB7_9ACTN|nr:hypothetical protein SCOCK_340057 [Actinacidiphila cocklensis]